MFTSGSTGEPKGVMLTHANIMSNLEGLYQIFHVDKNDRLLGILPFFIPSDLPEHCGFP